MKQTDQGVKHLASPEQDFSVWPFRSGRFGLAVSVRPFGSEPFRSGRFGLAVSVSRYFGQTMKSCRNFTLMQST